jgi:hypothetical protein
MSAVDAEKKQKDYLFTNQLKITVYSKPKGEAGRKVVARLFMGEWSKKLDKAMDELKVRFGGGEGYAKEGDFGEARTLEAYFIDVGQGDAILSRPRTTGAFSSMEAKTRQPTATSNGSIT